MKKLNKVAVLFASAALAVPMASTAMSHGGARAVDNWRATDNTVWRNGDGTLCWRDSFWTPATGVQGCDGVPPPPAPAPPPPPPAPPPPPPPPPPAAPPPPAPPAPAPAPAAPTSEKVTYAADAFFAFDSATLTPEARAKLDDLVDKTRGIALEVVIAVGHTDSTGPASYNQQLSVRRANAVKAYLVSKGIEANRVYTEGKGQTQPVADNRTREGRAKNRRVEIEVVGTRPVRR